MIKKKLNPFSDYLIKTKNELVSVELLLLSSLSLFQFCMYRNKCNQVSPGVIMTDWLTWKTCPKSPFFLASLSYGVVTIFQEKNATHLSSALQRLTPLPKRIEEGATTTAEKAECVRHGPSGIVGKRCCATWTSASGLNEGSAPTTVSSRSADPHHRGDGDLPRVAGFQAADQKDDESATKIKCTDRTEKKHHSGAWNVKPNYKNRHLTSFARRLSPHKVNTRNQR